MKDSDITVYKSFLLKLSYGAPGWPVSRFRSGVLVFILPDFGRDTDDLDLRHDLAAREHTHVMIPFSALAVQNVFWEQKRRQAISKSTI